MDDSYKKNVRLKKGWYPPAETRIPISALCSALLPCTADFQSEFRKYLKVEHCVIANSGRVLQTLVLKALFKASGSQRDEVLIPGYTCYSVAASIVRAGLKIRVYDLDPHTFQPDEVSVSRCVNEKTLAIVAQHLFGIPTSVDGLRKFAETSGAILIEDAAQALGASVRGCQVGTLGDFGFYSFGRGKPLPLGCGGALIGRDHNILQDIALPQNGRGYRQLFMTAAVQLLSHRRLYGIMEALPLGLGETIFDPEFTCSSMPAIIQKLGKGAIDSLEPLNNHRCTIARIYNDLLQTSGIVPIAHGTYPIYTRFPYMYGKGDIPNTLLKFGIRRMYPKALKDQPQIRKFIETQDVRTPGAAQIADLLVTLPTHTGISKDLAEKIAAVLI